MVPMPPAYVPKPGPQALARRLRALLTAEVPVACGVYVGLAEPGALSARHAEVTYARAHHLVTRSVHLLPHFNTNPPPVLRVVGAVSWGRADALTGTMADFPADLATGLWRQVVELVRYPSALSAEERRHGSDLLLRLGYLDTATDLLGMRGADASTHVFTAASAVEELAVLSRRRYDHTVLEARVLAAARERVYPPAVRLVLGNFVVVRNGRRGTDTPAMHEAADLARDAVAELDGEPFPLHLAMQKFYRATAFVPFLAGDVNETLRLLDQAVIHQEAAKSEARSELEQLAWIDHAFPLYETIAKTHIRSGNGDEAVSATDRLVALSPNDERAWDTRGQALLRAGRLEEALNAYGEAVPLGGLPVARATYHLGWIHGRLGNRDEETAYYRTSQKIDPTVPVVADLLANDSHSTANTGVASA